MSVRMAWTIALVCCLLTAWEIYYLKELTADAPKAGCEIFVNSLDCSRDSLVTNKG